MYDFIIVGGGVSAISFLRKSLELNPCATYLIIERGKYIETHPNNLSIFGWPNSLLGETYEEIPFYGEKSVYLSGIANVLGGGHSLNTTIWVRDNKNFFDKFKDKKLWNYCEIKKIYEEIESLFSFTKANNFSIGDDIIELFKNKFNYKLIKNKTYNKRTIGYTQITFDNNTRQSALHILDSDYVFNKRKNVTFLTESVVDKLLFKKNRAYGVQFIQNNKKICVYGKKIIVAAGALQTPCILMRSGYGPKNVLRKFNIKEVCINEYVGQNLEDSLLYNDITFPGFNYNNKRDIFKSVPMIVFTDNVEIQITNPWAILPIITRTLTILPTFFRKYELIKNLLRKLYFLSEIIIPWIHSYFEKYGLGLAFYINRPHERGSVVIQSINPCEKPYVKYNLLENPKDQQIIRETKKINNEIKNLIENKYIEKYKINWLLHYLWKFFYNLFDINPNFVFTDWHASCTCKIDNVVNSNLSLMNTKNVYIIDMSILPRVGNSHPVSLAFVLGYKGAIFANESTD